MWLALETATDCASVALGFPGAVAAEENLSGSRRHAAGLVPIVLAALGKAGASLGHIEGVVLADGPGSFTGLRVGAAFAKALVGARGLPLWTAPSLMVMALGTVSPDGTAILAVQDALRGELYAAVFRVFRGRVESLLPPTVLTPEAVIRTAPRPALVVGSADAEVLNRLATWSGADPILPPASAPRASVLLGLVGRAGGARRVEDPGQWEPEYGRPAEAQVRWEVAHGRRLPDSSGQLS
ncbi:MAG: tRNA (adenosine(37)-N6)-threonylcarbamoyltransferase complex dimerization subunit type 1 TsaB [Gemmatimonadales bacterium]